MQRRNRQHPEVRPGAGIPTRPSVAERVASVVANHDGRRKPTNSPTREETETMPNHHPDLVALSDVALRLATAELHRPKISRTPGLDFATRLRQIYGELADRFADVALLDDLGSPAIDRALARQVITEKADKLADDQRTAETNAAVTAARIEEHQRRNIRPGVKVGAGGDLLDYGATYNRTNAYFPRPVKA